MGTGTHVFLNEKPLNSMKKGSRAHGNRKSRVFEWETAEQYEKGSRAHTTGSHVF